MSEEPADEALDEMQDQDRELLEIDEGMNSYRPPMDRRTENYFDAEEPDVAEEPEMSGADMSEADFQEQRRTAAGDVEEDGMAVPTTGSEGSDGLANPPAENIPVEIPPEDDHGIETSDEPEPQEPPD